MSVTGTNLASATGATTLTSLQDGDLFYAERSGAPGRITYANIRDDLAGRAFTFSQPITFSAAATFSNTITASNIVTVAMDNARLNLHDTSGTANTHAIAGFAYNNSVLSSLVRTNTGDFVAFGWQATFNASGPVSYSFPVAGTERLLVTSSGATVTGTLGATAIATTNDSVMSGIRPVAGNTFDLGSSPSRWRFLYLENAPVVTSDARLKENIRSLNAAEMRAAAKIERRTFTMNGKRKVGYIAQEIIEAMQSEGLCAFEYGLVSDGETYGVDYDAVTAFRSA